jgi:tRNA(Ile)-lysidine synthase
VKSLSRSSGASFDSRQLLAALAAVPKTNRYWLGFSGGADSTALLLAMLELGSKLPAPVLALHFNHGLSPDAGLWLKHCREFCKSRDIAFRSEALEIDPDGGTSIEEEARNLRYQAVERILEPGEIYLTAHHADDQAETLFLNLMRGSGVDGLAGIPVLRKLGHGWVARPLLDTHKSALTAYLRKREITWLEDPSNKDESFDRNFLRQRLFPMLEQRWPGVTGRLIKTARHARATSNALAELLDRLCGEFVRDDHRLPLEPFLELDQAMQSLVLRHWLRRWEISPLPEARMIEFVKQLAESSESGQAEVKWGEWQMKRYRNSVWLQAGGPLPSCTEQDWGPKPNPNSHHSLDLGLHLGHVQLDGSALRVPAGWRIGHRREGDRMQLHPDGPKRKIKHLFQESAVPPWLRSSVPILYWDGEVAAVGDWLFGQRLKIWLDENKAEYHWRPLDPVLTRLQSDCHDSTIDRRHCPG